MSGRGPTTPEGIAASFRGTLGAFRLDVAFTAPGRGVTALFGPSGCGKTTVLRAAAGLHRFADGALTVAGAVWQDARTFLPPHRRPVGYVFQEASLFPHLRVRDNLDYGRRRALKAGACEEIRFDDVVDLLGLAPLLARAPGHLSGGERQRVALGRALLSQPRLLLMDEPLSALDRFAREEILPYFERLHARLGVPTLYVTHDFGEVERLADHVVLLEAGRVVASGALSEVQTRADLALARLPEAAVTLGAGVTGHDPAYDLTTFAVDGARLLAPGNFGTPGTRVRLRIAASDVALALEAPRATSILNVAPARIIDMVPQGAAMVTLVLGLGPDGTGARILARISRRSGDELGVAPGLPVFAQIKGVALAAGPPDGGAGEG